jgi:CRP-like cAMP-binding protein
MSLIETHLRKARIRAALSAKEEAAIENLISETRQVRTNATIVRHGEILKHSILLLDGWLARTRDTSKGERQILELHVAGDFADLHGFTLKYLDHDLVALTPSRIALAPHESVHRLVEQHPRLARLYWLMTNIDAAIQREWTFSMARRSATARLAHLFCELFERLQIADRVQGDSYDLPLTQGELSECVGLTPVHVNRTLQSLRSSGLITLEARRLTILDHGGLRAIAEFDPEYLYMKRLID